MGEFGLKVFKDISAGLATRPTPLLVDVTSDTRMRCPEVKNVSTFKKGALSKRLGVTQYGSDVTAIVPFNSQLVDNATFTRTTAVKCTTSWAYAVKFTAPAYTGTLFTGYTPAQQLQTLSIRMASAFPAGSCSVRAAIYTNVADRPGVFVNTVQNTGGGYGSLSSSNNQFISGTTVKDVTFTRIANDDVSLIPLGVYWAVFWIVAPTTNTTFSVTVGDSGNGVGPGNYFYAKDPVIGSNGAFTVPGWSSGANQPYVKFSFNNVLVIGGFNPYGGPPTNYLYAAATAGTNPATYAYADAEVAAYAVATKFTAAGSKSIYNVLMDVSASFTGASGTLWCAFYDDVSGHPGTMLGSKAVGVPIASSGTKHGITFNFGGTPTLTISTDYWLVIYVTLSQPVLNFTMYVGGAAGSNTLKECILTSAGTFVTWTTASSSNDFYYEINALSQTEIINGLYDFRFGTSGTQKIMACAGGNLDYYDTGNYTSLISGLGSGQDKLWCFATLKDLLLTLDYGNNIGRCWDGAAAYTVKMGVRATYVAAEDNSGSLANGVYKVMPVTRLKSGGFRAGEVKTVTIAGGKRIKLSSINMDGTGATDLGFEVTATTGTDTTWYMTEAGLETFRKIPTANLSTANPSPNNTTTAYITSVANLSTSTTLLDDFDIEQGYFTSQIDAPKGKFMLVWNNMVVIVGTGDSKIWFSEEGAPNVWSTYGGLQGGFEYIKTNDGDDLNGLYVDDGYLYAQKKNSTYMIQYTQNQTAPFAVRQISNKIGTLSHFSNKTIPGGGGFATLSSSGPYRISGTSVALLPGASDILDKFNPSDTTSYNLASMFVATAGIDPALKVIKWGVSSHSATTRDLTLVWDYESGAFWEDDAVSNYYTEITDSNYFPSIWGGGYVAKVFQYDTGTDDDGNPIAFMFATPHMQCGGTTQTTRWKQLHVSGKGQAVAALLDVEVYVNQSTTASQTFQLDMAATAGFDGGYALPIGLIGKSIQLKFRNSQLGVPVQIDSLGLSYEVLRESYGSA